MGVRRLVVANGPNIFQMLLVIILVEFRLDRIELQHGRLQRSASIYHGSIGLRYWNSSVEIFGRTLKQGQGYVPAQRRHAERLAKRANRRSSRPDLGPFQLRLMNISRINQQHAQHVTRAHLTSPGHVTSTITTQKR